MSYGETAQESRSESGVFRAPKNDMEAQLRNVVANSLIGRDPLRYEGTGVGQGGLLGSLFNRAQATPEYKTPDLSPSGLLPEQESAFRQAVSQAMSGASGNFARRGFTRPEHIQAIAGSAAQNVSPMFMDAIARNVDQRTQAPLVIDDVTRKRFADLLQALGLTGNLFGGTSFSGGSGWNAGYGGSVSMGGSNTSAEEGEG